MDKILNLNSISNFITVGLIFSLNTTMYSDNQFYLINSLMNELKNENLECVKWLILVKRVDLNLCLPELGISAMHLISGMENEYFTVEVMHLALHMCNGDPNARSEDGLTPVHLAAMWGRCKILELLLEFGGNPHLIEYKTALNAEDLALRDHQWQTYAILAAFTIMRENDIDCFLNVDAVNGGWTESRSKGFSINGKYSSKVDINSLDNPNMFMDDKSTVMGTDENINIKECTKSTQTNFNETQSAKFHNECTDKLAKENSNDSSRKNSLKFKVGSKFFSKNSSSRIAQFFRNIFLKTHSSQKKLC